MCADFYSGCVIHHSESRVHQVKRSWVMLTQRFWQLEDRSWTLYCAVLTRLWFLFFPLWFNYLCLVLKHSGSQRYKCESHVKYSFIKGASAVVAALANVCRLELYFLPCQTRSRPLAALLPQSVRLSADKKTPAHPAVCQRWCWDTQNSQAFLN